MCVVAGLGQDGGPCAGGLEKHGEVQEVESSYPFNWLKTPDMTCMVKPPANNKRHETWPCHKNRASCSSEIKLTVNYRYVHTIM